MTQEPDVLVREPHGPVLVARLNRPEARNALNPALVSALGQAVLDAEADPSIRVLVLTGTGDRAFCAGMDLRAFSEGQSIGVGDDDATVAFRRLLDGQVSVPVVGAANASAVAGGLELLLGCDVVVASTDAAFGLPEVKRGLYAAGGGTMLGTRIPLAIALELLLTGDTLSAERAEAVGLINRAVAPVDVLPTALDVAERIAQNAPLGLAASKELARLALTDPAAAAQRRAHWSATVFTSHDAREGATAFVEKRPPEWTGR
jgi:enoyl-CoA hydratase